MSGRSRGGRGGRGGFGRGGRPTNGHRTIGHDAPFSIDIDVTLDGKPSEQFPEYDVPKPPTLTKKEEKQVESFLLFREQCHDSPLYTHARAWKKDPSGAGKRAYGQEQINKRYKDDNMIDPFTAVPTYSQRFQVVPRNLPDLTKRPFALKFFPPELHSTLTGSKKNANVNKSLVLSSITSYKTVEDLEAERLALTANQTGGETDYTHALEILKKAADAGEEGGLLLGEDDDDWVKKNGENEDEDEDGQNAQVDEYDDESGDDYDAEQYFEGNQDDDDYDDAGDDGEAYY